jgi:hypothetical protein
VSFKEKTAVVTYDDAKSDLTALTTATTNAGYPSAPKILESVITCPHCGTAKSETMPPEACQFFYVCTGCGELLKPKQGDCCVFCSYGSVRYPPIQTLRYGETGGTSCCTGDVR